MKKLLLAAVFSLFATPVAQAANAPILVSVGHEARHPIASWTLPQWVEAEEVEVATKPETASDGQFWRENVVVSDRTNGSDTQWLYEERLRPGTYYVHVQGYDSACLHAVIRADCGYAWSNVLPLTISAEDDPPRIVYGQSIGNARLGMTREQVEVQYGSPTLLTVQRTYFPLGTKYAGQPLVRATYRLHGGALDVAYVDDIVKMIATTSGYYRNKRGVGVGTQTPRGRCLWRTYRIKTTSGRIVTYRQCHRVWGDFWWTYECGQAWRAASARVETILSTGRGRRITSVLIGDPSVILYCF